MLRTNIQETLLGIAIVTTCVLTTTGCATMANLNGSPTTLLQMPGIQEPEYFGGLKRYSDGNFGVGSIGDGGLFVMADTVFTLVGDIATLPLVYQMRNDPETKTKWTGDPFSVSPRTELRDVDDLAP